jgi:hypothetical protein
MNHIGPTCTLHLLEGEPRVFVKPPITEGRAALGRYGPKYLRERVDDYSKVSNLTTLLRDTCSRGTLVDVWDFHPCSITVECEMGCLYRTTGAHRIVRICAISLQLDAAEPTAQHPSGIYPEAGYGATQGRPRALARPKVAPGLQSDRVGGEPLWQTTFCKRRQLATVINYQQQSTV